MSDTIDPEVAVLTDDDIISFTQGTRKRFIDEVIAEGFPQDPKEQHVMLTALADMDRTALGNKRIGATERQSAADSLVARAITQLGDNFGANNPYEKDVGGSIPAYDASLLPDANPVPGETDIGLSDQNYKAFTAEYED